MKFEKKEISIKNREKIIYGEAYLPVTEEKTPFVIFSHGFNGRFNDFGNACEYLAERGIGAYGFDFCGGSIHSKSSLKTTEMTIFTEKEDLAAVVDNILQWDQVDNEKLFLFGGSQGGFVSSLVAEEYKDKIKALMLLFPAFCIPEDWRSRFPDISRIPDTYEFWNFQLGRAFFESIHYFDVFENIGRFEKEVLIFHGDKDDIVNISYSQKAASVYKKANMVTFPGEGHGFSEEANRTLFRMVYEFIDRV